MTAASKISLAVKPNPALKVPDAGEVPHIPLLQNEPYAVLGADRIPPLLSDNVAPDAATCFGPRGAALMKENGPLWVCDTGHHRLLGWKDRPASDAIPADWVIGQQDFRHEGRNGKTQVNAASVNVPTGICPCGDGMAVGDAWNHRVLIWNTLPEDNNVPADIVLGQDMFNTNLANHGSDHRAAANSFHWPYGVACFGDRFLVADSENRRVLLWDDIPSANGQPADHVLGQMNFTDRDENAGSTPTAMSMRWPHGIALWRGNLCVSDAGNNRIMVWEGIPTNAGQPCDYVLGQSNMTDVDHNQSLYWPRANTLNMPYAIAAYGDWLIAADTASSRIIAWHIDDLKTNASARALSGQINFHEKGDNRWQPATSDSLCWPYGIQVIGNHLVIADSGNNRVSLWRLAL